MRTNENIVSSFFYYMWNMWSKEECHVIFPGWLADHIWGKWECAYDLMKGPWGAAEYFYKELDDSNRALLVNRACEMYNGRENL